MRRIFGHGRYATVTSTLALVVALSSTAYAANTVRSSDIVDGAVKSVDIGSGAVTMADASSRSLGRSPRIWAQISSPGGSVIRGAGVASAQRPTAGEYTVTFNRDVSNCAVQVTPFSTTAVMATYQEAGTVVTVRLFDDLGAATDVPFDIVVVC
jgi:hypothetical protein